MMNLDEYQFVIFSIQQNDPYGDQGYLRPGWTVILDAEPDGWGWVGL